MKGYVTSRISEGGGIDKATGLPYPEGANWSEKIECHYLPNSRSTVGVYQEGQFRVASYEITISTLDWNLETASMIRLHNSKGAVISKGSVLTLDDLEDIQRIKITI